MTQSPTEIMDELIEQDKTSSRFYAITTAISIFENELNYLNSFDTYEMDRVHENRKEQLEQAIEKGKEAIE